MRRLSQSLQASSQSPGFFSSSAASTAELNGIQTLFGGLLTIQQAHASSDRPSSPRGGSRPRRGSQIRLSRRDAARADEAADEKFREPSKPSFRRPAETSSLAPPSTFRSRLPGGGSTAAVSQLIPIESDPEDSESDGPDGPSPRASPRGRPDPRRRPPARVILEESDDDFSDDDIPPQRAFSKPFSSSAAPANARRAADSFQGERAWGRDRGEGARGRAQYPSRDYPSRGEDREGREMTRDRTPSARAPSSRGLDVRDFPREAARRDSVFHRIQTLESVPDLIQFWRASGPQGDSSLNAPEAAYLAQRIAVINGASPTAPPPATASKERLAQWARELETKKTVTAILTFLGDADSDTDSVTTERPRFRREREREESAREGEGGGGLMFRHAEQALDAAATVGARVPDSFMQMASQQLARQRDRVWSRAVSKFLIAVCNGHLKLPDTTAALIISILADQLERYREPPRFESIVQDSVSAVHSLVRLGCEGEARGLLERLEQDALSRPEAYDILSSRNLSSLLWSYVHLHRPLAPPAPSHAAANDAATAGPRRGRTSSSSSTNSQEAGSPSPLLLEHTLRRLRDLQGKIPPNDAGYILWALVKGNAPRELTEAFFEVLRGDLTARPLSLETLSMTVWAVGHPAEEARREGREVLGEKTLLPHCLASLRSLLANPTLPVSGAAASSLLYGLARLGRTDAVREITQQLNGRLLAPRCRIAEVSSLLWTWATLNVRPPTDLPDSLLRALTRRARDVAFKTDLRGAATVLWSLAKLGELEAFDFLLQGYLPTLGAPNRWGTPDNYSALGMLFNALSTANVDLPAETLAVVQGRLSDVDTVACLGPHDLSCVLYFHADMGVPPGVGPTRTLLAHLTTLLDRSTAASFALPSLVNCAWSLAALLAMGMVPPELAPRAFAALQLISTRLAALQQTDFARPEITQLFHARMLLQGCGKEEHLPLSAPLMDFAASFWRQRAASFEPTPFAKQVAGHLTSLGLEVLPEYGTEDGLLTIDLAVPALKIAVECDGPDHFVRNTRRLKGRRGLMVDTLLQSRGWRVLRVPYADYEGARGAAGKLALLKTLLEREGVALPGSPTAMESADGAAAAAAFAAGGMGPGTSATSGDREAQRAAEAQTRE